MLTGLSFIETWEYTSQLEDKKTPAKDRTVFVLGALDVAIQSWLGDNAFVREPSPDGTTMRIIDRTASRNFDTVRFGLKEVRNFKKAGGGDISLEFEERIIGNKTYKVVTDDTLRLFPIPLIVELSNEILSKNSLTEEQRKKLRAL